MIVLVSRYQNKVGSGRALAGGCGVGSLDTVEPDPKRPPEPPELLRKQPRSEPPPDAAGTGEEAEVGDFRPGSAWGRAALGRYLVGRSMTESIGTSLLLIAIVFLCLAALSQWLLHSTALAVLFVIVAVFDLVLRWLLLAIVRRLTAFPQYEPIEDRLNALVRDTRRDVFRELRRVGLPSHVWTLPLLAVRLVRTSRRAETVAAMRAFEIERVVPKARLDETYLLLQQAAGGGVPRSGPH
jgi:hypothetical protein